MLGHALIFEGVDAFADTVALQCLAYNNAFAEANLPWLWGADEIARYGGHADPAESIRLYAADTQATLNRHEIRLLSEAYIMHFTSRAARFGVPLRRGVEQAVARARRDGRRVGIASRDPLAPAIRLYNTPGVKVDALGLDVADVARMLDTAQMDVVRPGAPVHLVETIANVAA